MSADDGFKTRPPGLAAARSPGLSHRLDVRTRATLLGVTSARDLEEDLRALAPQARDDDAFADEVLLRALQRRLGPRWTALSGTARRRYAAGVVADLRGQGECYLDFYCSPSGAEETISERVAEALVALGWHGTGHGAPLRLIDFRT